MPDGIWEVGGRPAPGPAVPPHRGSFVQRFWGASTQQLHWATRSRRAGCTSRAPSCSGSSRRRSWAVTATALGGPVRGPTLSENHLLYSCPPEVVRPAGDETGAAPLGAVSS